VGVPCELVSIMVVMQGAVLVRYEGDIDVRVNGLLTVSVVEAAHFSKTKFPSRPPFVCTNATCPPSSENTGEVRIWPPVS
jgi:hypothetical protein